MRCLQYKETVTLRIKNLTVSFFKVWGFAFFYREVLILFQFIHYIIYHINNEETLTCQHFLEITSKFRIEVWERGRWYHFQTKPIWTPLLHSDWVYSELYSTLRCIVPRHTWSPLAHWNYLTTLSGNSNDKVYFESLKIFFPLASVSISQSGVKNPLASMNVLWPFLLLENIWSFWSFLTSSLSNSVFPNVSLPQATRDKNLLKEITYI